MKCCLFFYWLGNSEFHVISFHSNFSFERSDISRLARLVRRMNEKQSLLTIVLRLFQHLTSWCKICKLRKPFVESFLATK